jgi:hypothetical protein
VETPQTDATHVDTSKANASKAEAKNTGSDLQQYLTKLLENETSPESLAIKNLILKRIALEGDVKPARIPAPLNITQIGGYINLMEQLNLTKLQERTLTSILGLPVQYDEADFSKDLEIATLRQELAELKKEIASLKVKSEEQ